MSVLSYLLSQTHMFLYFIQLLLRSRMTYQQWNQFPHYQVTTFIFYNSYLCGIYIKCFIRLYRKRGLICNHGSKRLAVQFLDHDLSRWVVDRLVPISWKYHRNGFTMHRQYFCQSIQIKTTAINQLIVARNVNRIKDDIYG